MILEGFTGPSYQSQSILADGERTVNWFPVMVDAPGSLSKVALYPTPGLSSFATVTQTPVRGLFGQSDRCFAVGGRALFSVSSAGAVVNLGAVAADAYPATLTTNGDGGDQLFITSGGTGYILDLTTLVLTTEVSNVTMGAMLDGYFLALDVNTSTLKISDNLDGLTWDPTQVAQRSTASDPWRSMLVVGKNIWLFGEFTSELWYDSGDSPFPFAPFPGALIQTGIAAVFSAAQVGNNVCWLAQSQQGARTVVKAQGVTTQTISTDAVNQQLSTYDRVDDAEAFCYQQQGHTFYVLNFPSANATWVWDDTEQLWHERGTWNTVANGYDVWRPNCHASIYDVHLAGDRTSGAIYTMDPTVYTDAGGVLRRLRITPGFQMEQAEVTYHALRLFVEPGVGLSTGQGSDPQMTLRWSDDGGKTWGNELSRSIGAIGKYKHLVEWNRLGQSRYPRVWELVGSDPVPYRVLGAWLNPTR